MTNANSPRPTDSVQQVLLDSIDDVFLRLVARLNGLDDAEYRWEPVADMWSVRAANDGDDLGIVDLDPDRAIKPAPVTTIAWRLWHLASDCFGDYAARFAGTPNEQVNQSWPMHADAAIHHLQVNWRAFRAELVKFDDWFAELGPGFGPWHRHCVADFAMHASNELAHHAAEIALLRDLFAPSSQIVSPEA